MFRIHSSSTLALAAMSSISSLSMAQPARVDFVQNSEIYHCISDDAPEVRLNINLDGGTVQLIAPDFDQTIPVDVSGALVYQLRNRQFGFVAQNLRKDTIADQFGSVQVLTGQYTVSNSKVGLIISELSCRLP